VIRSFGAAGLALSFTLALGAACGGAKEKPAPANTPAAEVKPPPGLETEPPARPKVVALGDSITAGLGVLQNEAYPAQLQQLINADGYEVDVINGGESGDTSATALRRAEGLLDPNVKILIVAVGGNDALRGVSPNATQENVLAIVKKAQGKGIDVLLTGMQAPPNLGEDYASAFRSLFYKIARDTSATFVPFLLEGVAGIPEMNQDDGIHPTAAAHKIIAASIYEKLKPLLDDLANRIEPSPGRTP
jgi:acyl-CoA thioesterase-1